MWPSSPQVALFEKLSCHHDGHNHMGSGVLWKMNKMDVQTVTNKKCKKPPLWWYGAASVPTVGVICIYVKVPMKRRPWNFGVTYAAVKMITFSRNFMSISAGKCQASSAQVTTVWLRRHRVHVLDRPACSPDLSPIENVWCIMRRIRQQRPQKFHLQICNKWYLQFPNDYKV